MNHTLKSLLITSMLTIPTVFASHDSLFGTNSDAQPAAAATALGQPTLVQQTDVPALLKEADRLRNLKTSTMDSAEKIRLHTASADLYETAAKHPNATPEFIRQAANNVSCLVAPISDRALPLFELFVNSSGVTPLHIQAAADTLNNWKIKHAVHSDDTSYARLQHIKKVIKLFEFSTTHPKSTLEDILKAADKLGEFEKQERLRRYEEYQTKRPAEIVLYLDGSVAFYEQAANHPDATLENIRFAADKVSRATLVNIRLTADKESNLGDYYPEGSDERNLHLEISAKLYTKLANHLEATPGDILNVANSLNALAKTYPMDSAEKLKLTAIAKNLPKK
jgi:hypothetical protein